MTANELASLNARRIDAVNAAADADAHHRAVNDDPASTDAQIADARERSMAARAAADEATQEHSAAVTRERREYDDACREA